MPPTPEIIAAAPEVFVGYVRVRIDPRKSEKTDRVLEFVFTDKGDLAVALHVRRGVCNGRRSRGRTGEDRDRGGK
ncbi:MAG: hypothetical protein BMS9Abin37_0583 [Acidobacteriota bacterium]|nr:MAG: hypothetical protein BMS9Abin37_0583 [Acidobacteriota bacterium]